MTHYQLSAEKAVHTVKYQLAIAIMKSAGDGAFARILHYLNESPRNTVAGWARANRVSESTIFSAWRRACGPMHLSLQDMRRYLARAKLDACVWYGKLTAADAARACGLANGKRVTALLKSFGYRDLADRRRVLAAKSAPGHEADAITSALERCAERALTVDRPLATWTPRKHARRPFDGD